MSIKKNVMIAALAAAALGLSACGDDTPQPTSPPATVAETTEAATEDQASPEDTSTDATTTEEATPATEEAPVEEVTEETTEPVGQEEAPTDFPFEEGPVDVDAFLDRYIPANSAIKTMKSETTSSAEAGAPQVTYVDNTDPDNPRSYSVIESGDMKIETVAEGTTIYTRTNEGTWDEQDLGAELGDLANAGQDPEMLRQVITSAELVSKAERQFNVVMDIGAALGGESGGEGLPATMWLDEQFRLIKQEVSVMGVTSTTVNSEFNEPVDIPSVS